MASRSLKKRIARAEHGIPVSDDDDVASPRLRPRGTLRRRVERAGATAGRGGGGASLPLNNSLRRQWAKGELTSRQVQELAFGAACQGADGLEGISTAGSSGARPQNIQRSLLSFFGRPSGGADFTWIRIPTRRGSIVHPVFMPHLFFSRIYHERRDIFDEFIRGPDGAAARFWDALGNSPLTRDHPGLLPHHLHKTLPIGLHGDGGSFSKQDSLFVLSWNSICGASAGRGFGRRWLFTIVRKSEVTAGTMDVLWQVIGVATLILHFHRRSTC